MNEIMNFEHEAFGQVRTVACEGEPWFMASDIAEVLGYREAEKLTRRLDEDEMTTPLKTGSLRQIRNLRKDTRFINESGLYTAIMHSSKLEAKRFKKWVTSEVLPSIRKNGGYVQASINESPEEIMARALVVAQQTLKRVEEQKELAESQLQAVQPKVEFAEALEVSEDTILVRELAKLIQQTTGYKTGGNRFYRWLRDNGYPELLPDWRVECSS
jgi:anti-repressor protein